MCQTKMHPCRECGTLCEVKTMEICGKELPQITCPQPLEKCCLGGATFTLGTRYETMDLAPHRAMRRREILKRVVSKS